jgi:RNA polymerase sigma-70 factor (ECF subfamily)
VRLAFRLRVVPPEATSEPLTLDGAFRRYASYVGAIALKILGRDAEVDDVVQDVFLIAYKGLGSLRDEGVIKHWLGTVAVRVASRRLRIRRLRSFFGLGERDYDDVAAPGATPEQRALLASIYAILDTLPVNDRLAWTLRNVEGMDLQTVAEMCNCSLATAKRRIAAAAAIIDKALADE